MRGRRFQRHPCPGGPLAGSWKGLTLPWCMVSVCRYLIRRQGCFLLLSIVRAPAAQREEMWSISSRVLSSKIKLITHPGGDEEYGSL